ncbi:MAG: PQQ-binding-like beta-propeller repeat protein [Pirellulaceae bacterium]|nr:PQQ-binding-like beta-propeller repeat protein [Pirellulaceae bacterium]
MPFPVSATTLEFLSQPPVAVVPVLVGPLQALLVVLGVLAGAIASTLLALFRPRTVVALLRLLWAQKWVVAMIAVAAFGAVRATALLRETGRATAAAGNECSAAMFRGGPDRRGWFDEVPGPAARAWNWTHGDSGAVYSSPVSDGRYVYLTTADKGLFRDAGRILCLDAATGGLVWSDCLKGYRATFSSPAISGDFLVSGEGLHDTDDARIVCLDRVTGRTLWEFRTASHVESSPCICDGRVYVGAGDDGIYCLELKPNPPGEPRVVWHAGGTDYPDAESSPLAWGGRIYIGLGKGGRAVCCLDAQTGTELWRSPTPFPVWGAPAVVRGRIVVSMGNGDYVNTAEKVLDGMLTDLRRRGADPEEIERARSEGVPGGAVRCLDAATGKTLWEFRTERGVLGAVAAGDERLFFGSRDGRLYSLNTDGGSLGTWNVSVPLLASPALAGDRVYAVTSGGILYALDALTLDVVWEMPLLPPDEGEYFLGSPAVAAGRVFVGTSNGLVCAGGPGQPPPRVWAGLLGGPGRSGDTDRVPLPGRAEATWTSSDSATACRPTAPIGILDGALYAPCEMAGSVGLSKWILSEDPDGAPLVDWFRGTALAISQPLAVDGCCVYALTGRAGESERELLAFRVNDGTPAWSWPVAAEADGTFALGQGRLLAASGKGGAVECLALDGDRAPNRLWRFGAGAGVGMPLEADARVIAAFADPALLVVLDAETGAELWARRLDVVPTTGPILQGERILLGTEGGVIALSLCDGAETWRCTDPAGVVAPLVGQGAFAAAVTGDERMILLDADAGRVLKSYPGLGGRFPPLLAGDSLFVYRGRGVVRTSLDTVTTGRTFLRLSGDERIFTPLVAAGGDVYFGTATGIVRAGQRAASVRGNVP